MSWRGSEGTSGRNGFITIISSHYAKRDEIFGRAEGVLTVPLIINPAPEWR
jgi:hypothetical protein